MARKNKDQLFDFLTRPGTFQETFGGQPLNFDESGKAVLDKDEPYFLGGIVKGIGKAIGGVAKGIGNFVGGAVKAVGNVISNPIVGTALSFIPGMQIPMAIANGVVELLMVILYKQHLVSLAVLVNSLISIL